MSTFIIGLLILVIGGFFYGGFVEKIFQPDKNRKTPAITNQDGVDYVPMNRWKNALIQLLNIAGTGPILGPILGILFGPIAFIMIPMGCVLSGGVHDYMCGMISIREGGKQMPAIIRKFLGNGAFNVYNIFVCVVMILVGAVFIYTPGDLVVGQVLSQDVGPSNPTIWVVYGIIFAYYLCATLLPIDKIIGRIYPIFGLILLLSSIGVFFGIFLKPYELTNLSLSNWMGTHPDGLPLFPVFFVTVACGITSGFHATQATIIGRSVTNEKEGRTTFYNMMIVEGFIAMVWAAAAMGIYTEIYAGTLGDPSAIGTPAIIGLVSKDVLGSIGGIVAIFGVIVLPITSGDTALRSVRLMLGDFLKLDQKKARVRLMLGVGIFVPTLLILIFAKMDAAGFNILWRYFAWSNQTLAVFAFAAVTVFLAQRRKAFLVVLIPGVFYCMVVTSYILNAQIGFRLPLLTSYIAGGILTILYIVLVMKRASKMERLPIRET